MTWLMLTATLAFAGPMMGPPNGAPRGPPPPPHVVLGEHADEVVLSADDRAALDAALANVEALEALDAEARAAHEAVMEAERAWVDALQATLSADGWEALRDVLPPPPPSRGPPAPPQR